MIMPADAPGTDLAFLNSVTRYEGLAEDLDGSSIKLGSEGWGFNNSNFDDYCASFGYRTEYGLGVQENEGLKDIIEKRIGQDPDNIGLDIAGGSDGVAIRDLIAEGIINAGLVTNLFDLRTEETKADDKLHHISGDIVSKETWEKIMEWKRSQAPNGFALIMHRPMGALQAYPAPFYVGAANFLLDMLRPGGVFFTQVPDSLRPNFAHDDNIGLQAVCEAMQARPDIEDIAENSRPIGGNKYASPNMVVLTKR